ncbi:hypothetical protein C5167_016672 [Papaver somniferum]|nr:hypothetical protein C5167_016672 [Papaver somniferum]
MDVRTLLNGWSFKTTPGRKATVLKRLQPGCGFCAGIDTNFRRAPVAYLAVEPIGTSPSYFPEQGSITRQCELKEFGRLPVKVL